jgi:hypothetical protein
VLNNIGETTGFIKLIIPRHDLQELTYSFCILFQSEVNITPFNNRIPEFSDLKYSIENVTLLPEGLNLTSLFPGLQIIVQDLVRHFK